jgi:hypothetical protein
MTVLPKPAMNHAVLKGCGITMATVRIKLCEKLAARRLTSHLEEINCIPVQVGGTRPGRSTTTNVEVVTPIMQNLQTKCAAIATYDLEDAYTRVDIRIQAGHIHRHGEMDCDTSRMQSI